MNKVKLLSYAIAGLVVAPAVNSAFAAPQGNNIDPQRVAFEMMQINAEPLKGPQNKYAKGDIWERLRSNFQMSEVNPELVRKHEQYYASRAQYFNRTLARGSKYLYFITEEVERRNMPAEIALLPVIESAFVTKAKSHVGASGLWQFMPATGTQYGLEQTWWYDGRRDVYDSTRAALDYLGYLHNMFDDWSLALASYNWGEGSVGRAVKRAKAAGLSPTYENLKMPNETRNYVPKLLAVRNLIDNPENFGLKLEPLPNRPYFEAINVGKHMDTALAANLAEISLDEFYTLNPGFNLPVYADKAGRKMLIPVDKVGAFNKNLRKWGNKPLLSWDIHSAQGGDTVASLAAKSGMTVTEFREVNGVRGNALQNGRPVLMAKNSMTPITPNYATPQVESPVLVAKVDKVIPSPVVAKTPQTDIQIIVATNNQPKPIEPSQVARVSLPTPQVVEPKVEVVLASTKIEPKKGSLVVATKAAPTVQQFAQNTDPVQDFVRTLPAAVATEQNAQVAVLTEQERRAADEQLNKTLSGWNKEVAVASAAKVEASKPVEVARVASTGNYKVKTGDTLYRVAKDHNMNVQDLRALNNLSDDNLLAGRVLQVSGKANNKVATQTARKAPAAKDAVYTVQKGDSWYKVARKYGVDHKELMKMNTQGSSALKPGQQIKVRLIDL